MEGVERYKVNLMPHNAAWKEEYKQVSAEPNRTLSIEVCNFLKTYTLFLTIRIAFKHSVGNIFSVFFRR